MNRPSRGACESATTTRYDGRLDRPVRLRRMETTSSPPWHRKRRQATQLPALARHALQLSHHLPKLRVLLEQPIDVLHAGAAAPRDPLAPAAVDHLRMRSLGRRHGRDDGVETAEVSRLVVQFLGRALEHLAEGQHAENLIQRAELAHLTELLAEVLQREGVLAELPHHLLGLRLVDDRLR